MKLQQVLNRVCKACEEYQMIEEGDRIAVGVSGGKDSLTLLYALAHMRRFFPKEFELEAITVDLGFPGMDFSPVARLCRELGVNYTVVKTRIADIVHAYRKEDNPCSLCAKLFSPLIDLEKILLSAIIQIRGKFHDKKRLYARSQRTDIKGMPRGRECCCLTW